MDDQRRSNPKAAQVRIEARKATAYAGQRNHDLRRGAQPSYVDTTKAANNEILIEPPAPGVLRNINEGRRSQRDTKRAMRSCLLYTSPSPRDGLLSRMPSSA